jgi:hypothetical protein
MGVPPLHGVDEDALDDHGEMEVVAASHAGLPGPAEDVALGHRGARRDVDDAHVGIHAEEAAAVVQDDGFAVDAEWTGKDNPPVVPGGDGALHERSDVNAEMDLAVDLFAAVVISPLLAERGHGLPEHSDESPRPEPLRSRGPADRPDPLGVGLALGPVHGQEDLEIRALERGILVLEVRDNSGQEAVAHLDPVQAGRLGLDVRPEVRLAPIAGLVLRPDQEGSITRRAVRQGEIDGVTVPRQRKAGEPCLAYSHTGRGRLLVGGDDDQPRAALIDVVRSPQDDRPGGPAVKDESLVQDRFVALPRKVLGGDPETELAVYQAFGDRPHGQGLLDQGGTVRVGLLEQDDRPLALNGLHRERGQPALPVFGAELQLGRDEAAFPGQADGRLFGLELDQPKPGPPRGKEDEEDGDGSLYEGLLVAGGPIGISHKNSQPREGLIFQIRAGDSREI